MVPTADRVGPSRGPFARLLAAVTIFAAMMVLLAPLCADGMFAAMPMASTATTAGVARDAATDGAHAMAPTVGPCAVSRSSADAYCAAGAPSFADAGFPGVSGGALIAACLVVIAAIVVMVLGIGPPRSVRAGVPSSASLRWPVVFGCGARRPDLAELCVLRT